MAKADRDDIPQSDWSPDLRRSAQRSIVYSDPALIRSLVDRCKCQYKNISHEIENQQAQDYKSDSTLPIRNTSRKKTGKQKKRSKDTSCPNKCSNTDYANHQNQSDDTCSRCKQQTGTRFTLSLEDAIAIHCQHARVITEPTVPHTVVHCNASFTKVTGIDSHVLVGSSINKLFANNDVSELLLCCACCKNTSRVVDIMSHERYATLIGKGKNDDIVSREKKKKRVRLLIFPIFVTNSKSSKNKKDALSQRRLTHFLFEFHSCDSMDMRPQRSNSDDEGNANSGKDRSDIGGSGKGFHFSEQQRQCYEYAIG